jgi:hypothetical protein
VKSFLRLALAAFWRLRSTFFRVITLQLTVIKNPQNQISSSLHYFNVGISHFSYDWQTLFGLDEFCSWKYQYYLLLLD